MHRAIFHIMSNMQPPSLYPKWIDSHALGIVKALQKSQHETYLVGGCVRDLLIGIVPKDFDIATNAHPEEVKKIIYKSYVIGKRFRLVLVKRDDQQFEVATFRKDIKDYQGSEEDLPSGDNLFGTAKEDAQRRDFTINGLFYDPIKENLIDYAGGLDDLKAGIIRMIGDPTERLIEDPIRILRALRLAHKIDFSIETELKSAMQKQSHLLKEAALPRKREEYLKLLRLRHPSLAFIEAYDLNIFAEACPQLHEIMSKPDSMDTFLSYLNKAHEITLNRESPVELFGFLVLSFIRAQDSSQSLKLRDLNNNEALQIFMKDELGMFKYEQALVLKALQLQSTLAKRQDYERKGARRRLAVLKSESFPLALKIAAIDLTLSSGDWHFWLCQFWESLSKIEALRESEKKQRRTKRRRPQRSRIN